MLAIKGEDSLQLTVAWGGGGRQHCISGRVVIQMTVPSVKDWVKGEQQPIAGVVIIVLNINIL